MSGTTLDEVSDRQKLLRSEFGEPFELAGRYTAILISTYGLWVYLNAPTGPIWAVGYFASQVLLYASLRQEWAMPERTRWALEVAAFCVSAAAFMWMPLYLLTTGDTVLVFCATTGLMALCIFNFWRDEPPAFMLYTDVLTGWLVLLVGLAAFLPLAEGAVPSTVMVVLCIVTGAYYAAALTITRRYRRSLREAANRGAQSQKMEAIGRLSGGIAHDFNNILTVIRGNLDLHEAVVDPREKAGLLEEARRASERASGLVSRLMAFARQAPMQSEPVEVNEILYDIGQMSRRLLPESIELTIRPCPKTEVVMIDRDSMTSAILNMIINARDAMGGSGAIQLSARALPEATPTRSDEDAVPHIQFNVCDNRPGLSKDALQHATEPFFTTKDVGKGSGLGLSMARGFAEQSGGLLKIDNQSELRQGGASVSIILPIVPTQSLAQAPAQSHMGDLAAAE